MTKEEKISMLENIMDLDEGELTEDTLLADFEEWDSLSKLSLVAEAKRNFGLVLTTDQIGMFVTVNDVCEYLK